MEEQLLTLCTELGRLPEENHAAFLERHPQLLQASVVADLAEAVRHKLRVDVPEALVLAEAAVVIGRRLGDLKLRSRCREAVKPAEQDVDILG